MNDCEMRAAEYVFIARRNNSLSSAGRRLVLVFIFSVSLSITLAFGLLFGAWPMLPFAGLECAGLYLAFRHIEAHAGDYERVAIAGSVIRVEVMEGQAVRHFEFNRHWVRLVRDAGAGRVALRCHGDDIELGRHLCLERRAGMAGELEAELRRGAL